jgi:hypothetical protein
VRREREERGGERLEAEEAGSERREERPFPSPS